MHDFITKRNALFACLDNASSELKGTILDQTRSRTALGRTYQGGLEMSCIEGRGKVNKNIVSDRALHFLRGKESIFKKPELPIARCLKPRKLADYQINPHKWKKYSLADADISDQTNLSAALAFLKQIEERKCTAEPTKREQTKIEFKRSCKIRCNIKALQSVEHLDAEMDSPRLKGSKLVMPEYVVGQKKTCTCRKNSNGGKKERAVGKILLSHLEDVDDQ